MNKDVIYIEPEDDITDIIGRIKNSTQKVVALVPPKKAGILRSAVNMKLIAKTAKSEDRAAVIVSTDPSLIKLSALSGLPVAKTLNSRPMLPTEFTKKKKAEVEELEENEIVTDEPEEEVVNEKAEEKKSRKNEEIELDEEVEEDDEPKNKKKKEKKPSKIGQKIPNFDKYRKWIIAGGVAGVVLIIALIWGLFIAPAAEILVNVKTNSSNIAENVTLVTNQSQVDVKAGKFLLEQIKYEEESSVEFDATGTANKGEKATGKVTLRAGFSLDKESGDATLKAGATVAISGKNFVTNDTVNVKWDGKSASCDSRDASTCYIQKEIGVTASEAGAGYNIAASTSGNASGGFGFVKSTAMTGGTDKNVKVVSESDINDAKSQLSNNSDAKEKLYAQISDSVVKIESSFKAEAADPVSTPKKGEEVSDGKKAKLTAKTTYTIYVVDKTAIDEYVKAYEADKIADGDRLYSTGSPFFERFTDSTNGTYTAKFKTTVKVGPEVSEQKILETAMGGKVGAVKAKIKDISNYINDVTINVSFPWVWSIPNDENRVTVKLTVEE